MGSSVQISEMPVITKVQCSKSLCKSCKESTKTATKTAIESWFNEKNDLGLCPGAIYLNGFVDGVHKYRKIIPCNKSYCRVCGTPGSLYHRQKFARGLTKMLGVSALGYFVFTFPDNVRSKLLSKEVLGAFQDFVRDLLKGYPFVLGGVSRWHWGGDKSPEVWNPHLNVLINLKGGVISKTILNKIRAKVLWWIFVHLGKVDCVFIHYQYCLDVPKIVHSWNYITRPTLLLCGESWVNILIEILYNFRNVRWWGYWNKRSDEFLGKGVRVLLDESIKWKFGGSFKDVSVELLNPIEWEYKGFGIFYRSRASPDFS